MARVKAKVVWSLATSDSLDEAARTAANRDRVSLSHFLREAVIARLTAEGVDPMRVDPADSLLYNTGRVMPGNTHAAKDERDWIFCSSWSGRSRLRM